MRWTAIIVATCGVLALGPRLDAAPLGYYEWVAVAPIVVSARGLGADGRWELAEIEQRFRGPLAPGDRIRVDLLQANRSRPESASRALRWIEGRSYLLLLRPCSRTGQRADRYELVRGVAGFRELPAEGAAAVLSAITRFVEVQDVRDDRHTWEALASMLDAREPLLVQTALGQFLKFRRGHPGLLVSLRGLLLHDAVALRADAARLIGQILERPAARTADLALLEDELAGRARRDAAPEVRSAATEALASLGGPRATRMLEGIAADDPDQHVRYTAARLLHALRAVR